MQTPASIAAKLLRDLRVQGIQLSANQDRLDCYAPKGALTAELKDLIAKYKTQLCEILHSENEDYPSGRDLRSRAADDAKFPLSIGETSHYLLQLLNPTRSHTVPICIKIGAAVNVALLQEAWNATLKRYPILKTRIVEEGGVPYHMIDSERDYPIEVEYLTSNDDAVLIPHLQAKNLEAFDLHQGPLVRISLIRRAAGDPVLFIVVHHIVFDGYSAAVLLKALFAAYRNVRDGTAPRNEPAAGYQEFVAWESAMLNSEAGRNHVEYWQQKLAHIEPGFKLLPDLPKPSARAEAAVLKERIPTDLAEWVHNFSNRFSLPPSVIYLGIFQLLLCKVSGQNDIVILMPTVVRPGPRFADSIGYFFNVVPIRTQFAESRGLLAGLRDIHATVLDSLFHSAFPFSLILEELRKVGGSPEFRILYAYQNFMTLSDMSDDSLKAEFGLAALENFHQKAEEDFDLAFEVFEDGNGFRVHFQGNAELYPNELIRSLYGQFCALLRAVSEDPGHPMLFYPIITPSEERLVLHDHNATDAAYPRNECIHQLFAEQVRLHPDRVAVRFGEQALSYESLDQQCSKVALCLQARGVKPDTIVGVCMERSIEMMIAIMGIVKAGGAYLPLDPDYPDDRLRYMLDDSRMFIVLTQTKFLPKLDGLLVSDTQVIAIDGNGDDIEREAARLSKHGIQLREDVLPHHVAYVIYTSGSTGKPKGVMVEHRALVNRIHWMQKIYQLTTNDVVLQKTPYSFDVSVWEFFWPMICGSSLVFAVPDGHMDVHYLEKLINRTGITTLHFVPSMLHTFLDNAHGECPDVKRIFCSGEALDRRSVDRYQERFPNSGMFNLYGPTEAAIDVTAYDCSSASYPFVPIGNPIDNIRIYILDEYRNPQPIWVPGELFIAGDGLARGYLNRPELTAEKFVANPRLNGDRMYKTGDLARWLDDGNIQYLGRMDVQVKIGGVRIETEEIEAHMSSHPDIAQTVVIARGEVGCKQLVAFYLVKNREAGKPGDLPQHELRSHLLKTLPEYMIPAAFVRLNEIPRTSSGKVDRRALDRIHVSVGPTAAYVAPRTDVECQLAIIWATVFKEQGFVIEDARIGVEDDFFELGGNSLLATQLIYKIRSRFAVDMPVRMLFKYTKISQLAQLIEHGNVHAEQFLHLLDLEDEARLDPEIQPSNPLRTGAGLATAKAILLTGATGFLGAYLLHELLRQTESQVFCLVRGDSNTSGEKRVRERMQSYALWNQDFVPRIVTIPGDLALPRFGLTAEAFDDLCAAVDAILHNGANVNFIHSYHELKHANVIGTQEVLRLACRGNTKPVHFVSTVSVFEQQTDATHRILETEAPVGWRDLPDGYSQSKWVAERMVSQAAKRGVPVRIYRLGAVTGDSQTGIGNPDDFMSRMLKGCSQLGLAPHTSAMVGMVPVDYASRAIVKIARLKIAATVFHIVHPRSIAAQELGKIVTDLGLPMTTVPYEQWREALAADVGKLTENALHPLLHVFGETSPFQTTNFDCRNTLEALEGTGTRCPEIDSTLIGRYLDYFKRAGVVTAEIEREGNT